MDSIEITGGPGMIHTITQKRRLTRNGQYHYQEKKIYTKPGWVKTGEWITVNVREIGREKC